MKGRSGFWDFNFDIGEIVINPWLGIWAIQIYFKLTVNINHFPKAIVCKPNSTRVFLIAIEGIYLLCFMQQKLNVLFFLT